MQRVNVNGLAHQTIKSERAGERNGNPGKAVSAQGQIGNGRSRDEDREPLPAPQPFTEEDHAQRDREQWVDEVTQAGLQEMFAGDRVNEREPIQGDEHSPRRTELDIPAVSQYRPNCYPLATNRDDQCHEEYGPQNAMAEDNYWRDVGDRSKVERDKTPHRIGAQGIQEPCPRIWGRYRRVGRCGRTVGLQDLGHGPDISRNNKIPQGTLARPPRLERGTLC